MDMLETETQETTQPDLSRFFPTPEKMEEIRRIAREVNAKLGISLQDAIDPVELQERLIRNGVRPEDCGASRELMRMRYPDDEEYDDAEDNE